MFELSAAEKAEVITNCDHLMKFKFAKSLPYAFTEHGAIMAASVLNSSKAVQVSVFVVRAFVQLGEVIAGHRELAHKITASLICGVCPAWRTTCGVRVRIITYRNEKIRIISVRRSRTGEREIYES
jgi:hypothetical protein